MSEAPPPTERRSEIPVISPRWGFIKGFVVGAVVEVPAFAGVLWLLGVTKLLAASEFMHVLRVTAAFAGIAALFTAGGIGRVAAYASIRGRGGRLRSTYIAAATHAVAGIGLAVISGVANGLFTTSHSTWLWIAIGGLLAGAVCGAMIGVTCGGPAPIRASDLFALAKKPTDALFQILDPEDLVRIGTRVKDRATQVASGLVDGLFDPAELPPESMTNIPVQTSEAVSSKTTTDKKPSG
jgi:hypothetical protein